MKILLVALMTSLLATTNAWETDLAKAKQSAQTENKLILLNFSGSDWCGPCIRLHKEIFDSKIFSDYAQDHLVLVNADFPRLKKNQLSKEQKSKNEQMAELYNKEGKFPFTLLLNAEGKVLKSWEGFPLVSAEAFTDQVKAITDASR